ncbi:hypothetical protein Avbf_17518 [Armadillidium vulgare]|nr:hypothetical protein Avbf_17518 [Armadillidium vulgare]
MAQSFKRDFHENRIWVPLPDTKSQQENKVISQDEYYERQLTKEKYCFGTICDRMVRHAQELSRLKLIRRYVRDTVATLDRLVTALDAELIAAGENLQKSFGDSCRSAHAVLNDVTEVCNFFYKEIKNIVKIFRNRNFL